MSYQSQHELQTDPTFVGRCQAAMTQQALVFKDDEQGDIAALADTVLRAGGQAETSFIEMLAASPGFAEKVETAEGIDQSLIADVELLAAVQALWPTVAALYFDPSGALIN